MVRGIKSALLEKNFNADEALTDAAAWIAELTLQIKKSEKAISAGYTRTDTSHLSYLHPPIATVAPTIADDGAWIATGKE